MTAASVGSPIDRVDAQAKVTGRAKYAAEHGVPDLTYGWVVSSEIARGRIIGIDTSAASQLAGVLRVFTHENTPRLAAPGKRDRDEVAPPGSPLRPLHDGTIKFSGQPIALVVAETLELARYAATLIAVEYECDAHSTSLEASLADAEPREEVTSPPDPHGHAARALENAPVRVSAEYHAPSEHHNPMEPFATTVVREDNGRLIVYDKTQGVQNVCAYLTKVFGFGKDELRVLSPFVGGAFGAGLRPQYQVFLAVLAARELKRSVRVVLTRQQMFSLGCRPATWQRVSLGAASDGTLEAIKHEAIAVTSRHEDYSETVTDWSGRLYQCGHVTLDHRLVRLDVATPLDMRAPGAAWGLFALESAMDELAVALRMDPFELRLKNYTDKDQDGLPFSSKELRACYRQAADRFGWKSRRPEPRSMRDGHALVGWGMATGIWEAEQLEAAAKAVLTADGRLAVSSATADIGTGTYTVMTQLAADLLGLPIDRVTFTLGDSSLSKAPVEGGSFTASSVGSAVHAACGKVRRKAFDLARRLEGSPLAGARLADVVFSDGAMCLARDRSRAVPLVEIFRYGRVSAIEEEGTAGPRAKQDMYARFAHSAMCAEVSVDEDLGTVRVTRVVSAIAAGRILNPKTARSQVIGGIVGGIGMALEEESVFDHALGRIVNHSLAEYHVAVNADVPEIEVMFVEERDTIVNPIGVKGIGEIGIVGVAAAIANAVYHATGTRIRRLPITLDKLL